MTTKAPSITAAIIEALYREALLLADEARAVFERPSCLASQDPDEGLTRIALSCEALRTTTRMMHALAWLLNHRAFLAGELSEYQIRRHGRLPLPQPASEAAQLALLDPPALAVIAQTQAFYARIERLDTDWREQVANSAPPVQQWQGQLGQAFSG